MSAYEKKPFNINKLKLNDLINRCDSNTLKKCMKEAIKLFGGYKAMLFYLINNMNTNQLQLMQGKVMKQYTKYNTSHSTSNINPFETLPKVLMTYHICKYLNQDDINQFKLTSRNIAIICYERKNKKMSLNKLDIFERNYVCVEMKTNKDWIKQSIQKHYDNALNKNEACFFKYEIETIFDVIDMNKWKVNVTSGLIALKQQVSKLFGNFIAPKYIEFTHPINGMILREKDAIHLNSNVSRTSLNGHIVWKRNDKISENDILYTVNIFDPFDCPYPLQFDNNATKSITFLYDKKFKVRSFINDIFDMLKNSLDHILMDDIYRNLINLYFDENNDAYDDEDMMEYEPKIQCILSSKMGEEEFVCRGALKWHEIERKKKYNKKNSRFIWYNDEDIYNYERGEYTMPTFNLYMIRIKSFDELRNIKIEIKFVSNDCSWYWNKKDKYVGLPLNIWINKTDTLWYIIDKYLKKIGKYIWYCFHMRNGKRRKAIMIDKWNEFVLYKRMNLPNDWLLFKVKKCDIKNTTVIHFHP
eukprot:53879_1